MSSKDISSDEVNKRSVYIDNDHNLDYETNNIAEKILKFFFIPILNSLPQSLRDTVRRTHKSAKVVMDDKASHNALEVMYKHGHNHREKNSLKKKFFRAVWFNINNTKAVRNRLRAVKRELNGAGQKVLNNGNDLKILSIASGSARAIIETIANLYVPQNRKIYANFLDKNPHALDYSKEKVDEINFDNNFVFNWHTDTASNFPKYCQNLDIIEMVGLLDYFDDEKTVDIFKIIYENLQHKGVFITANIDDNNERKFVTNFIDWRMIYRDGNTLKKLAMKAGFEEDKIKTFYEPLKIHTIMIATK